MKLHQTNAETNEHGVMNNIDDSLVEKVWNDLNGQVSREQISRVVATITLEYQDAAVKAFVPIFIHREALEQLKKQLNENRLSANGRMPTDDKRRQANEPAAKSIINL